MINISNEVAKYSWLELDLCYYPSFNFKLTKEQENKIKRTGVHLLIKDNNMLQDELSHSSYNIIIGIRMLCTCPPTCNNPQCEETFFQMLEPVED